MEPDFWHERWRRGEIGFHQSSFHPGLARWWPTLGLPSGSRVLVPLCGKSLDMVWLHEAGHTVVGAELSQLAVEEFFAERRLAPRREPCGELVKWSADGYEIWCGDFFTLVPDDVGDVRGVYDRAAFHAMPPDMLARYTDQFTRLLPDGARGLVISLDYPQHEMAGPPFSLSPAELESRLAGRCTVALLESSDTLAREPRFRERGVTRMQESVCSIVRTGR